MTRVLCTIALAAAALGAFAAQSQPRYDAAEALRWAERLAGPELRGRRSGTPDGDHAARLIADAFKGAGLEPAGDGGTYVQSFTFPFYQIVPPARLAIGGDAGRWRELAYATDYHFLTGSGSTTGEADVVFAGYGLDVDGRRDYATLDVRGRIVVALDGAPAALDLLPAQRATFTKARTAQARGARGLLLVPPSSGAALARDRVWVLRPENYFDGFLLGRLSAAITAQIFGIEPTAPGTAAAAGGTRAAGRIAWQSTVVFDRARRAANVLGRLTGTDVARRDEIVLLGAHYDGGGVDPDGTIYPGAEDNASGASIVIALAPALAAAPRTARTIVLAAWGAEEQGAWGSKHHVDTHPALDRLAATFTLDNVGVGDGTFSLYGATNFPGEWATIAPAIPADLRGAFTPRGAGGSDGWTFQIRGIPSFFAHAAAPQPYVHTPDDTPGTLARMSLDHAGRFMAAAVRAAADAPAPFIDGQRLERYLARHAFVAGYTRAARPDWASLRRRGFDLVVWEQTTPNVSSSGGAVPEPAPGRPGAPAAGQGGVLASGEARPVIVRGRADLADTEEGRPLRILPARRDGQGLALDVGGRWMRGPDGWTAPGLVVRLVTGDPARAARGDDVALLLDADAGTAIESVTGALLRAGQSVDDVETLVGGRIRAALLRAMPPR